MIKRFFADIVNGEGHIFVKAGDKMTEAIIDAILADGTVKEMRIRNNEIVGIEVEAITEGKKKQTIIESLHDRIIGRNLAEDILDEKRRSSLSYQRICYRTDGEQYYLRCVKKVRIRSV